MSSEENTDDGDSPRDIAEDIVDGLEEEYQDDVDADDIVDKVETFTSMSVTGDDLYSAVHTSIANDLDVDKGDLLGYGDGNGNGGGGADEVTIEEAKELGDEQWITLTVKATEIDDEPRHESMSQSGTLGDETGTLGFVAWETSNVDTLEEGETYTLENVITDEYQGRVNSVGLNSQTEISEADSEISEVGSDEVEFTGALVAFQNNSGLIKRCSEEDCSRALNNGECYEHGDVEDGEHDIRLMAVLDNGETTETVIVGDELTEAVTGLSKEDSLDLFMDTLEEGAVEEAMWERVGGRYFTVTGNYVGSYIGANDFELSGPVEYDEQQLIRARSMAE